MDKNNKKSFVPGLVVIALGLFLLYLSISISNNPVQLENRIINFITEARFLPLMISITILILGVIFTIKLAKGTITCASGMTKDVAVREGILTLMTVVYLVLVTKFNFLIPTTAYLVGLLFYLNWGKKKWWVLLIIAAIYIVVALIITPYILQLKIHLL